MIEKKQGNNNLAVTSRLSTKTIQWLLGDHPQTRREHLDRLESAYNFAPPSFPPMVFVELTNVCNLACTFCPHPDMKRKKQVMDYVLVKKVIDEIAAAGCWYLSFHFFGEPLTAPGLLIDAVLYAKGRGIHIVSTTTNLTLMSEQLTTSLITAGLDSLHISFDGIDPANYEAIRGYSYDTLLDKIKLVRQVRDELNPIGKPYLEITAVRTNETDKQVARFYQEMTNLVDSVDVRSLLLFNNRPVAAQELNAGRNLEREQRIPCRQLGGKLIICSNGEATVCCNDLDAKLTLGNVKEKSLAGLWQSDEFGRLWMLHRQQRWTSLPGICQCCRDWDWGGVESQAEVQKDE